MTDATRGYFQQLRTGVRHATRGKGLVKDINICTYNPRTINDINPHALDTLLYEIQDLNWDIIGLAETKVKESRITSVEEGHKLFLSGNNVSRSNEVGFFIHKSLVHLIDDYKPISDRLAILSLKTKFSKIFFIQCYFPTTSHPDTDVLVLYDQIQDLLDNIPKRDHIFLMGDFNSKVGNLSTNFPTAVGKHALGTSNKRGEMLPNFCVRNDLLITNTIFKKRKLHTWTSPDGKTKNQIDFIS